MNPYHVMTLTSTVQKATNQQAAEAAFYETKRRKRKTEQPLEE